MAYLTSNELQHIKNTNNISWTDPLNTPDAIKQNQSQIRAKLAQQDHFSPEKRDLCYAQLNAQFYEATGEIAYFTEARKHFEKITSPSWWSGTPAPENDYRNQAHLFLGELWKQAHAKQQGAALSRPFQHDACQLAVKHYQQVTLNGSDQNDAMMVIKARHEIALLFVHQENFPQQPQDISNSQHFKPDHLRTLIAAIEVSKILRDFPALANKQNDFESFPNLNDINVTLSPFFSVADLAEGHLVFLNSKLDTAQRYKIARTCYDKKLIDDINFHSILRHLHDQIRTSKNKDDRQCRRNIKFYLTKLSLQLYYHNNQHPDIKQRCLEDLTGLYKDLIGTKKELHQNELRQGKPKAFQRQKLLDSLKANGTQPASITGFKKHIQQFSAPFIAVFGGLLSILFAIQGLMLEIVPKLILFGGIFLLTLIGAPLLILAGLGLYLLNFTILFPLIFIGLVLGFGKDSSHGFWGQKIENRWLDTGITFIFRKIGEFLGTALGSVIGVTLGVISYIPRVIVEGLGNLGRKDNHKPVSAARLQKALDVEHLALDIGKAPLDYSREDKHYSNYQNPDDPQAGIRKYTARFFVLNNDNTDRKEHFSHSKHAHQTNHTHQENTYDKLPDSTATPAPSAPPLDQHEVKQYDDYVLNASKFSPSCGFD